MKKIICIIIIVAIFLGIAVFYYKNVFQKKTITDGTFVNSGITGVI